MHQTFSSKMVGLLLMAAIIAGCTPAATPATVTSPAPTITRTRTPSPLPTSTSTAMPTQTATVTATPTPTATPMLFKQTSQIGNGVIHGIAWLPDSKMIAIADSLGLRLYDSTTLKRVLSLDTVDSMTGIAINQDGSLLAVGTASKIVQLWDIKSMSLVQTFTGHTTPVDKIAFSPDGKLLAAAGSGTSVRLWSVESGELVQTVTHEYDRDVDFNRIIFSPDSKLLATAGEVVRLWNTNTGRLLLTFRGQIPGPPKYPDNVSDAVFTSDGRYLVALESELDFAQIQFWDLETAELANSIRLSGDYGDQFDLSRDNSALVLTIRQGIVSVDIRSGEILSRIPHPIFYDTLLFSPDGRKVATEYGIWDIKTGKFLSFIEDYKGLGRQIALLPDDHTILTTDLTGASLWDVDSQEMLRSWQNAGSRIPLDYSPDGSILAMLSWDGHASQVLIQDTDTNKIIQTFAFDANRRFDRIAFSPDGQTLMSANWIYTKGSGSSTITLLDVETGIVSLSSVADTR